MSVSYTHLHRGHSTAKARGEGDLLAKVLSFGLTGLDGYPVLVETDVYNGLPAYELVGLPDAAVKESKERVRSAIKNSGFEYPAKRITVNLAPADLKKEGPLYDLSLIHI